MRAARRFGALRPAGGAGAAIATAGAAQQRVLSQADRLLQLNTFYFDLESFERRVSNSEVLVNPELRRRSERRARLFSQGLMSHLSRKVRLLHEVRYGRAYLGAAKRELRPGATRVAGGLGYLEEQSALTLELLERESLYLMAHYLLSQQRYYNYLSAFSRMRARRDPPRPYLTDERLFLLPPAPAFELRAAPYANLRRLADFAGEEMAVLLDSAALRGFFLGFKDPFSYALAKLLKDRDVEMAWLRRVGVGARGRLLGCHFCAEENHFLVVLTAAGKFWRRYIDFGVEWFGIDEGPPARLLFKPLDSQSLFAVPLPADEFAAPPAVERGRVSSVTAFLRQSTAAVLNEREAIWSAAQEVLTFAEPFTVLHAAWQGDACLVFVETEQANALYRVGPPAQRLDEVGDPAHTAFTAGDRYRREGAKVVRCGDAMRTVWDFGSALDVAVRGFGHLLACVVLDVGGALSLHVWDERRESRSALKLADGPFTGVELMRQGNSSLPVLGFVATAPRGDRSLYVADIGQMIVEKREFFRVPDSDFEDTDTVLAGEAMRWVRKPSAGMSGVVLVHQGGGVRTLDGVLLSLLEGGHQLLIPRNEAFSLTEVVRGIRNELSPRIAILTDRIALLEGLLAADDLDVKMVVVNPVCGAEVDCLVEKGDFSRLTPLTKVMFSGFSENRAVVKTRKLVASIREQNTHAEAFYAEFPAQNAHLLELNTIQFIQCL